MWGADLADVPAELKTFAAENDFPIGEESTCGNIRYTSHTEASEFNFWVTELARDLSGCYVIKGRDTIEAWMKNPPKGHGMSQALAALETLIADQEG